MPGPVVTDNYVACCICDGYTHSNFFDFRKPYLPIPRTLYCTWGSWAGNLVWNNTSLPTWFVPSGTLYNMWSGVATIPFKYRTEGAYGYCDPTEYDTTAECVVTFTCNAQVSWIVRARPCAGYWGCMELNESLPAMNFGGTAFSAFHPGAALTCGPEFSAVFPFLSNWTNDPPISDQPWYLWCHNVCDLQTSNCYISEA